jgi:hypothetical protein
MSKKTPDPKALTPAEMATLLTKAGGQPIGVASVKADVKAGAPTNKNGTLGIVTYAAWLVKQITK